MTTLSDTNTGYVFLDVDGIINPFMRKLDIEGWTLHEVEGYMVWRGASVRRWFRSLVEAGIQIVWATTWIKSPEGLRRLEKLYGLPELPAIDKLEFTPGKDYQTSCGKRPGIIRWLRDNKVNTDTIPVVWVDDDLGPLDLYWAEARGVKTVKPSSFQGLSDPAQLRLIEDALGIVVAAA